MRKVYNFLCIASLIMFFVFISCMIWLQIYGYDFKIFSIAIFCAMYTLFMGVASLSLEIDLIGKK